MATRVGLWIDHSRASIVAETDDGEVTTQIFSKVEKRVRPPAGVRVRTRVTDDRRKRRFEGHINAYYDAVIACLRDAHVILIMGPGEAKRELARRLEENRLGARIAGIEAAGKMTDRQVAAKIRQRFGETGGWFRKRPGKMLLRKAAP